MDNNFKVDRTVSELGLGETLNSFQTIFMEY